MLAEVEADVQCSAPAAVDRLILLSWWLLAAGELLLLLPLLLLRA
jgi:hypothetical protein